MVAKIYLGELPEYLPPCKILSSSVQDFVYAQLHTCPSELKLIQLLFFLGGGRVEVTLTYIQAEKMSWECQQHESKEERQPGINT